MKEWLKRLRCKWFDHGYIYNVARDIHIDYIPRVLKNNESVSFNFRPCCKCGKTVKFKFVKKVLGNMRTIEITPTFIGKGE